MLTMTETTFTYTLVVKGDPYLATRRLYDMVTEPFVIEETGGVFHAASVRGHETYIKIRTMNSVDYPLNVWLTEDIGATLPFPLGSLLHWSKNDA